jgi:hypothetical protein
MVLSSFTKFEQNIVMSRISSFLNSQGVYTARDEGQGTGDEGTANTNEE